MAHLSETYSRKGILSRNITYRQDSRGHLQGTGIYDNAAIILAGIMKRDADMSNPIIVGGPTQAQRVTGYTFNFRQKNGTLNFETGGYPYRNDAHHIIPVEVFYHEDWTAKHLSVVLRSKYNINDHPNIIYLPQCCGKTYYCDFHNLPDHSDGHPTYSERVIDDCEPIYDLVEEALKEKDCEKRKDIRKQIYDQLKQIELNNFNILRGLGAGPMH